MKNSVKPPAAGDQHGAALGRSGISMLLWGIIYMTTLKGTSGTE